MMSHYRWDEGSSNMSLSQLGLNWGKIGVFSNGSEGDMDRREGNITSLHREEKVWWGAKI